MKKILLSFLLGASCVALAQTIPSAEQLMRSGDPGQIAIGYQHCGTAMMWLGHTAIRSNNAEEGAGYIAIGQRYAKLFRNATDLRTEEQRHASQAQVIKLMQSYGEMAKNESKRLFLINEFKFCQQWMDED